MLVLSRKLGERIHVGNNVVITVVRIGPNAVRLGIEAPDDVNIARGELVAFTDEPGGRGESGEPNDELPVEHKTQNTSEAN